MNRRQTLLWTVFLYSILLSACGGNVPLLDAPAPTPTGASRALTTPTSFLGDLPPDWAEAMDLIWGICFESAQGAAFDHTVFVLRSDADLQNLYNLADNSRLCRRAVRRESFDFSGGLTVVGLWSAGDGCTASHEIVNVAQDDAMQTLDITLRLVIGGECPYELVRPWWVAIPGVAGYEISVTVE